MAVVLHHVALALAVAGLADAGIRLASRAAPQGAERLVAAVVIAAATAALWALVLGLVGLGTSPVALVAAAAATWVAARALLPAPSVPPWSEAGRVWRLTPLGPRVAMGAAFGAWLLWAAWLQRYPALGIDSVGYHLPEVVGWVGSGRPGAVLPIFPSLPVGSYPLTNEVLLAWGMGIARSFVWASLWAPLMLALLVTAGWAALRRLRVPWWGAALSVGALCTIPVLTHYQMNGANTDLPALAWLVAAAFLSLASARRPALLAPALVAAGLAVGTKTTTLPLAAVALGAAAYVNRASLRRLARPLALAAALAAATGGYWYLRNLVDHGSPLWPFVAAPWGDPPPVDIGPRRGVNASFLDVPGRTLDTVGARWLELFGSGFLLLAGSALAAVLTRRRAAWAAAGAALASVLLWANAPFSGVSTRAFEVATASTVRYLLPALAAAVLALALATGSPRRDARAVGGVVLGLGLVVGLVQTADLGFPSVPGVTTLLAGAVLGALAALAASRFAHGAPALVSRHPAVVGAVAAVLGGVALSMPASGYVERHAAAAKLFGSDATRYLAAQPRSATVSRRWRGRRSCSAPWPGDRLQHRFAWLPASTPCAEVRRRARAGYLLLLELPATGTPPSPSIRCLKGQRPAFRGVGVSVFGD